MIEATAEASSPEASRHGIALCLSGGGFRAALFHLGVVRRLNEVGLLGQLRSISSVSGGSILSAFLAQQMVALGRPTLQFDDFERDVAAPFRRFTGRDLRTWPVLLHLPWNWALPGLRARHLARRYRLRLTGLRLEQLPAAPEFVLCATDMVFGVNWVFRRDTSGDYRAGYTDETRTWPVATAVAASSCFPPVFGPLEIRVDGFRRGAYRATDGAQLRSKVALTDGGVYDNMALEPVWKTHQHLLVSDGGSPFTYGFRSTPWGRAMRYVSLVMSQAVALRRRMVHNELDDRTFGGATWTIADGTSADDAAVCAGYALDLVGDRIARVRTDLDRFTAAEQRILENHGYARAASRLALKLGEVIPAGAPRAAVPHPELLDDGAVRRALRDSHRRLSLRRLLHLS